MNFKKIIKIFEDGNVCVCGLRGRGKDMLFANVAIRRNLPYISNIDYGGDYHPFQYENLDCGKNTYKEFISGKVHKYIFPYQDKTDVYLSDAGIYFPSQYCSDLNRLYQYMSVYQGISRHVGQANFHYNSQALGRVWDKIREQADQFILCRWCWYWKGWVIQKVTIYDRYESAACKMKPLKLPIPLTATKEMKLQRELEAARFEAQHGLIKDRLLIYRNKSHYDTRRFKKMLEEGIA